MDWATAQLYCEKKKIELRYNKLYRDLGLLEVQWARGLYCNRVEIILQEVAGLYCSMGENCI